MILCSTAHQNDESVLFFKTEKWIKKRSQIALPSTCRDSGTILVSIINSDFIVPN